MSFIEWIVMWSGSFAPLCEIAELVDVDPVLIVRCESSHRSNNLCRRRNGVLAERYNTLDLRVVWVEDADSITNETRSSLIVSLSVEVPSGCE